MPPQRQMFSGDGLDHVRFGLGKELCADPHITATTGWTATNWTFGNPGYTHDTGNTTALSAPVGTAVTATGYYWACIYIATWTAGTATVGVGGRTSRVFSQARYCEDVFKSGTVAASAITPASAFDGKITYFSYRHVLGCLNDRLYPQWWGFKNDVDCSPALNAAIQAAKGVVDSGLSQGYGNTVIIPPGRFICNSPIYQPAGARVFGSGLGTVLQLPAAFATGTVPTYASLKYDAAIAEYDTGFWFIDDIYGGSWVQEILGDLTIDASGCDAGDEVVSYAPTGTNDFSLVYALRNVSYVVIKNLSLLTHEHRQQSHFFAGSEVVTAGDRYTGDDYARSGLVVRGLALGGRSITYRRFGVHLTGGSDAQLTRWYDMNFAGDCTLGIMDGEAQIENVYLHTGYRRGLRWSDECAIATVAGDQYSVTITGPSRAGTSRWPASEYVYYQRPSNVWGTVQLRATNTSTYSSSAGGVTTVYFNPVGGNEIPADAIALYSSDGGWTSVLMSGWGTDFTGLYCDSQQDVNIVVLQRSTNGNNPAGQSIGTFKQAHNLFEITSVASIDARATKPQVVAAEVSGRPDQCLIAGDHTALYTEDQYVYVEHSVDGWRKGQIVSASYGAPNTTLTTHEPIFRAVAGVTQTVYPELVCYVSIETKSGIVKNY